MGIVESKMYDIRDWALGHEKMGKGKNLKYTIK